MINLTLKNGKVIGAEPGLSIYEITGKISERLQRDALAANVNGTLTDLRTILNDDCTLEILTFEDEGGRWTFRHTAAHLLAQAVQNLYPSTKLAIGPAIENGFYYDFDFEKPLSLDELPAIEAEMKRLAKLGMKPTCRSLSRAEALEFYKDDPYKHELISELPENETITFYDQDTFTDLCAGPHVMDTRVIKALKLTSIAGAYWRGSEKNKMLTRVYGTAFAKQADLDAHIELIEEAKRRDHRKLGRELNLFVMMEEGQGFPFWLPNGLTLQNVVLDFWREAHRKAGYLEISTPLMLDKSLWETSGHADNYEMYSTKIEDKEYFIKPMNCPGGILVYKQDLHSYKEFPLRIAELGIVHRPEKSGTLHGLMRVRTITQDDAHIYLMPEQIKDEIKNIINLVDEIYSTFGFAYELELSTRPENSIGSDEAWEMATTALHETLLELNRPFIINEGDGAFYGPKIDFHLLDSLGRRWQTATIQLDFNLPERFGLEYVAADGTKQQPVMIHRTVYGSLQRFIGILIEHYAGQFPLWLSPVQAIVLPISDKFTTYAQSVENWLQSEGFRVEIDRRQEKIGFKIREAHNKRIPYIFVVGEQEEAAGTVSVRSRNGGDEGSKSLTEIIERMQYEVRDRK
ncbi:MAG: threonine--tRNA ligase [Defluviitaleaceae bacterium]|nr:threonine--tRNA ligase [Defluviitaleaceae bacterium]